LIEHSFHLGRTSATREIARSDLFLRLRIEHLRSHILTLDPATLSERLTRFHDQHAHLSLDSGVIQGWTILDYILMRNAPTDIITEYVIYRSTNLIGTAEQSE
jgi:hypothetical protein